MGRVKKAKYRLIGGEEIEVEYDPDSPCIYCGAPVLEASMGGTAVCPWCDCGVLRPDWPIEQYTDQRFALLVNCGRQYVDQRFALLINCGSWKPLVA